jgi:hypothetical protein
MLFHVVKSLVGKGSFASALQVMLDRQLERTVDL